MRGGARCARGRSAARCGCGLVVQAGCGLVVQAGCGRTAQQQEVSAQLAEAARQRGAPFARALGDRHEQRREEVAAELLQGLDRVLVRGVGDL